MKPNPTLLELWQEYFESVGKELPEVLTLEDITKFNNWRYDNGHLDEVTTQIDKILLSKGRLTNLIRNS